MLVCDYLTHAKAMTMWISLQNVIWVMLMNVRSKFIMKKIQCRNAKSARVTINAKEKGA